jgi:hypothetical protein
MLSRNSQLQVWSQPRKEFGKWFDAELVEHYVEGLGKAGLEVVDEQA